MKIIKKFKEGETVPDGAKFLTTEIVEGTPWYSERIVSYGLIFDTYQITKHTPRTRYYVYEVEQSD